MAVKSCKLNGKWEENAPLTFCCFAGDVGGSWQVEGGPYLEDLIEMDGRRVDSPWQCSSWHQKQAAGLL